MAFVDTSTDHSWPDDSSLISKEQQDPKGLPHPQCYFSPRWAPLTPLSSPMVVDLNQWDPKMVASQFAAAINLQFSAEVAGECFQSIMRNEIHGQHLSHLTPAVWGQLIPPIGPRLFAMQLVKEWQKSSVITQLDTFDFDFDKLTPDTIDMSKSKLVGNESGALTVTPSYHRLTSRGPNKKSRHLKAFAHSQFNNLPLVSGMTPNPKSKSWHHLTLAYVKWRVLDTLFIFYTILFEIFRWWTVVACILCVAIVWLFERYNLTVDFNPTLFIGTIIFPIAFSVQSAYARREQSLRLMASFKSSCLFHIIQHGTWSPYLTPDKSCYRQFGGRKYLRRTLQLVQTIEKCLHMYLSEPNLKPSERVAIVQEAYEAHAQLGHHNDIMYEIGVSTSLLSPMLANHQRIMDAFESLRNARDYGTPATLKCYMYMAIVMVSLCLTPYWALVVKKNGKIGYYLVVCLYLLMQSLVSLQQRLECPFEDDLDDIASSSYQLFKIFSPDEREQIAERILRSLETDDTAEN